MAEGPILETGRLRIVPFGEAYLTSRYVGWLNDPEVVRFSEQRHHKHSLASCREYWQSFSGTPHYFWAIVVSAGVRGHIGNMNAYVDEKNLVADVGILIGEKKAWSKGYGLEAWSAVCCYLLGPAGMRKVTAGTLALNAAMLRLMKKSGMVEDGRRIRHYLFDSCEVDVIHSALFRQDLQM
ncbi:MAG: GNAT family N-acetyltransferase [Syntrophaceae bacterium]|nr:GNAT family N-acetyltransferase [Syntrophaceae bacterium]